MLLILDLDETLIHATMDPLDREPNFKVWGYHVYKRPHIDEFIQNCLQHFRVAVWTSSSADYAQAVVAHLFPQQEPIAFLWSRERCTMRYSPETQEHYWVKNLKKVKQFGYELDRVLVVDDSPEKHGLNYGNLIRVTPFLGKPDDDELNLLWRYLERFEDTLDVRKIDKRNWRNRL